MTGYGYCGKSAGGPTEPADDEPTDEERDQLRMTIVAVLHAHLGELRDAGNRWPDMTPAAAQTDLAVREISIAEHVERVLERLEGRGGR